MAHRRHTPLTRHQSLKDIQPTSSPAALVRRRKYPTRSSPNSQRRALGLLHPTRHSASHTAATTAVSDGEDDDDEDNTDEQAVTPTATENRLRPVLAALHQNLRRLPSRLLLAAQTRHKRERNTDSNMRDVEPELTVQIGTKRKRVGSSNENAVATRRSRSKRMKTYTLAVASEESKMEVDAPATWSHSDDSDEDAEDDSCQCCNHILFLQILTRRVVC